MQSALDQFHISISRVRDLIAIHNSIKAQSTPALDLSDILRAALVLSVSALDYYVHEVVKLGMLEIHRGTRSEPPAFAKFQINLGSAREGLSVDVSRDYWLEDEIQQRHSYKSFQQPDNIADAIRLISDKKLWEEVRKVMNRTAKDIKQELGIIVDRRNKISHEADIDPTLGLGNRWNINEADVNNAVDFIEKVVESIHSIL
ncbi:MAG: HEPN domain-containing protein [Pseudanabaena sp. ELA607]